MSKISLHVNEKLQFNSKFGITINQYSNYINTLEVKFDYQFKSSLPAVYLYVERNDKSTNTLYSTQLIYNQISKCFEYQFGSNDGDVTGSWFTAIPGPLKLSFEIVDINEILTTDEYSIWINSSITSSNDKITLNAVEFNNIINFIQNGYDLKLNKENYDIDKTWFDCEEDFADDIMDQVVREPSKRKIFFTSIGDEPIRYEAIGLVYQHDGNYYCNVYSAKGINSYMREGIYAIKVTFSADDVTLNKLMVYNKISVPSPTEDRDAVNKKWLSENYDTKTTTEQKIKAAKLQSEEKAKEYSKTYTDQAINKLIDGAPDVLNTFKEVADYIASDKTSASQMTASINKNKQDIATNTNQINALEQNKLDKEDLIYENVENAPQEVVLIIRDVASPSTVNVAREIQFGNDVWKIGSNSGGGGSSIDEEILNNYVKKEELSKINGTSLLQANDLTTENIGINALSSLELEAILK